MNVFANNRSLVLLVLTLPMCGCQKAYVAPTSGPSAHLHFVQYGKLQGLTANRIGYGPVQDCKDKKGLQTMGPLQGSNIYGAALNGREMAVPAPQDLVISFDYSESGGTTPGAAYLVRSCRSAVTFHVEADGNYQLNVYSPYADSTKACHIEVKAQDPSTQQYTVDVPAALFGSESCGDW